MDDHSVFYATVKSAEVQFAPLKFNFEKNKKIYEEYIKNLEDIIKNIHDKIETSSAPVFLFGAHVFSQFLLSFGLDHQKIEFILDNDSAKQNKRLYGTELVVKSPMILRDLEAATVILQAGVYNDEIRNDILSNINPNVDFIED